jgi:hypothetical protein
MGIKDLLQILKSIEEKKNLKEYEGQTVGIDGHCW